MKTKADGSNESKKKKNKADEQIKVAHGKSQSLKSTGTGSAIPQLLNWPPRVAWKFLVNGKIKGNGENNCSARGAAQPN